MQKGNDVAGPGKKELAEHHRRRSRCRSVRSVPALQEIAAQRKGESAALGKTSSEERGLSRGFFGGGEKKNEESDGKGWRSPEIGGGGEKKGHGDHRDEPQK